MGGASSIDSLTVAGDLGIDVGEFAIAGGLTIDAGAGLEIARPSVTDQDPAGPATVVIGGLFTDNGLIGFGRKAHVTIGALDNTASGTGDMAGAVTVTNLDNAGTDFGADSNQGESGGDLDVTGTLANTGRFAVGNNGAKSSETMIVAALENESTGRIDITNATVRIGDVDNKAIATQSSVKGVLIDFDSNDSGDSYVHVTGTFTNDGGLGIGGANTTTTVIIATLDNQVNGSVDIDQASVTIGNVNNAGTPVGDTPGGIAANYPPHRRFGDRRQPHGHGRIHQYRRLRRRHDLAGRRAQRDDSHHSDVRQQVGWRGPNCRWNGDNRHLDQCGGALGHRRPRRRRRRQPSGSARRRRPNGQGRLHQHRRFRRQPHGCGRPDQ
jgi:hypothetical protein